MKTYNINIVILITFAVIILIWYFKNKNSNESRFRMKSGGETQRAIYKCSRTVYNCDWGCAGNSITCPQGCVSTSTQTFEHSGPCPYGAKDLGLVRFEL